MREKRPRLRWPWTLALTLVLSLDATAAVTEWVPFELSGGHIVLPIRVHGRDARAILDSGAQINGISRSMIVADPGAFDSSGSIRVRGALGTEERDSYSGIEAEVFGADVDLHAVEMNLPADTLLLGQDFFEPYVVQIDYPNSRIRLVTRNSVDLGQVANVEMRRDRSDDQPLVEVKLDGDQTAWLIFDTGNTGGVVISRLMAERLGWLEPGATAQGLAAGVNRVGVVDNFTIKSLKIGPFELGGVRGSVPGEGQGADFRSDRAADTGTRVRRGKAGDGLLGFDVLKHFLVTVDFKNDLLHLGPPEQ